MTKWEYSIADFSHLKSGDIGYFHLITKLLDRYGQDKWELVGIDYNVEIATFKRSILVEYEIGIDMAADDTYSESVEVLAIRRAND